MVKYIPVLKTYELNQRIDHFSASQINMMGCKFKWACRYLYNAKSFRKKSQMLGIGCFLHDAAKMASVDGKNKVFNRDTLIKGMQDKVDETKSLTKEDYPAVIDTFLEAYGDLDLDNDNTEVPTGGYIEGIKIPCTGFIDHILVEKDEKGIDEKIIIDLKTKSYLQKDSDGNVMFSDNERLQQGLYSYFMKIPKVQLYIVNINRRKKKDKVKFIKVEKIFDEVETNKILEIAKMAIGEMFSGAYPPNRNLAFCNSDMCEYWWECHELWG